MIPFIIGGVALAATGYGVAKLLEDDCNYGENLDSSSDDLNNRPQEDEVIKKFELAKLELFKAEFTDLKIALDEIENLEREILTTTFEFEKGIYQFEELSNEKKESFERYTDILHNTSNFINSKLDSLDLIIVNESDYKKYNEEEKELVDELLRLFTLICKVLESKITNDKLDISRKVKRRLIKIEKIIN